MLVLAAPAILLLVAFLGARQPWLLTLVLLLIGPLIAGFLILVYGLVAGAISGELDHFFQVFPIALTFSLASSISSIYPGGVCVAAIAILAWSNCGRIVDLDSKSYRERVLLGAVLGTAIATLLVAFFAIAGKDPSHFHLSIDERINLINAALDGVLVATFSRKIALVLACSPKTPPK